MPIGFLFDEHLRGQPVVLVRRRNAQGGLPIDVACVGDRFGSPPLGTPDPQLLLWCEQEGRILVSRDQKTMPRYLKQHLNAGHHSPGLFILKKPAHFHRVIDFLAAVAYASEELEWADRVTFIP